VLLVGQIKQLKGFHGCLVPSCAKLSGGFPDIVASLSGLRRSDGLLPLQSPSDYVLAKLEFQHRDKLSEVFVRRLSQYGLTQSLPLIGVQPVRLHLNQVQGWVGSGTSWRRFFGHDLLPTIF
jgi:hypothetical protein